MSSKSENYNPKPTNANLRSKSTRVKKPVDHPAPEKKSRRNTRKQNNESSDECALP